MQCSTYTPDEPRPRFEWRELFSLKLFSNDKWQGGVRLKDHKSLSNQKPIQQVPLARTLLTIPVEQGRSRATPCVKAGDKVFKGQVIATGDNRNLWVHASTSGTVRGVVDTRVADREQPIPAILLESDGDDEWWPDLQANIPASLSQLADYAMRMGLAGLGGAGFPTGLKLNGAGSPDLLLINGAECEPFLTCDDRLMRERASEVIRAADYLAQLSGVANTLIGVESNKPEAIKSLRLAILAAASSIKVKVLPPRYPAGGQPMLVRALSGRRLRPGQLPSEIGVQVLNVASVYALGRAVFHGEPLVSRVVTLTGSCERPGNYEVPVGYPVELLRNLAGPCSDAQDIHVGGPMMGHKLDDINAVPSKTSSCLIFGASRLWPSKGAESDCIRCNRCVDVCPMALQPMSLLQATRTRNHLVLKQLQLDACIECGACSQVCPSNLPLRDSFRAIKKEALICRAG